jgi:hypothetical protein
MESTVLYTIIQYITQVCEQSIWNVQVPPLVATVTNYAVTTASPATTLFDFRV